MESIQKINIEINELTLKIEQEYPELYQYLNENPITLPSSKHPDLDLKIFTNWLNSLKELLKHHIETHKVAAKK